MTRGHPVDGYGRALPDPAWPADRAAPDRWDVIRRFCNTANRESGADRLATTADARRWLAEIGLAGAPPGTDDLARLVAVRELVRADALAHHDRPADGGVGAALARHVDGAQVAVVARDGRLDTVPAADGAADRMIGTVALAIMSAQRDGCWTRFKACRNCEWVFYDHSRNRSGRWCSMNACGGRAKVAAFRRRRKEAAG